MEILTPMKASKCIPVEAGRELRTRGPGRPGLAVERRQTLNNGSARQTILIVISLLVIVASVAWICRTEFASPEINLVLHRGIGEVMAEETSRILGHKGRVLVIAIDSDAAPELREQLRTFEETLPKLGGVKIRETMFLDTENKPKYGTGRGLSGGRFVRLVKNKGAGVDAIVSFVGAPNLSDAELSDLEKTKLPKFIAQSGSVAKLKKLFDKKVLAVAIVGRYQFPAPNRQAPRNAREWFEKRYQIVTAETAATLPGPGAD